MGACDPRRPLFPSRSVFVFTQAGTGLDSDRRVCAACSNMPPALAIDLRRLALAPVRFTPRGIDRVELAYARHFLNHWPGECFAVLPTMWGVRCYERERALRGIAAVEELWRETLEPSDDPVFQRTQ